ncbi:odorant receptor 49b-like [Phymastichus coffea]|uniref:odorant receptor 49b-like n=1 Tax=Phymastichus coffea TaxID=108790 RepID=UPI00273C0D3C|nr:odorant receptor 49b-like [Phymastichus coffea]
MIYKRKIFESLFNESRSLWSFCTGQGQSIVKLYEQKIRRVYKMFFLSCIFVNIMYPMEALLTRLPPLEPNGTERRKLPYNWFTDNMENSWPGYWVIFVIQMVVVQNGIIYTAVCDTALPLLMMISSEYFRHLKDRINNFIENPNLKESDQILCIYFHQRLLTYILHRGIYKYYEFFFAPFTIINEQTNDTYRFCAKLGEFAGAMLLTQILSTGYNISLILIKLVSPDRDKYKYFALLGTYLCQLFMVQWAPDHLHDEVAFAAYSAYVGTTHSTILSKNLFTIILRAQRPVQFLAGGFIPLSLECFGNMIKNAFSFFTVLRNFDL